MKKFENLGRKLTKEELKKIQGGAIWYQSGYRLEGSNCFCDFRPPDEQSLPLCDQPCSSLCCYESLPCYLSM